MYHEYTKSRKIIIFLACFYHIPTAFSAYIILHLPNNTFRLTTKEAYSIFGSVYNKQLCVIINTYTNY